MSNTAEQLHSEASLFSLLENVPGVPENLATEMNATVSGINLDSRLVKKGDLFLACFGQNHDARDYIDDVISRGAAAVLAEAGNGWQGAVLNNNIPVIAVDKLSSRISELAGRFYANPSHKMSVFGITGTNGKTSCSQFIAQALARFGMHCGVMGTLGYGIQGDLKETSLTTPDAVFTQMALAEMARDDVDPVVMEVSSVGLHQRRVAGVRFDTAIFTNLSRDHLDYHASMQDYAESKKKLFTMDGLRHVVVNLDDPFALAILHEVSADVEVSTYSLTNSVATVYASNLELRPDGYQAIIHTPLGSGTVTGQLLGSFNFSNVLAVAAALISYLPRHREISIKQLCEMLSALRPVDGRMEIIAGSEDVTVVVDYAHTPESLRSALIALREQFTGKVWCVFGCGGNRDKGKRPLMGEIAEAYADRVVVADDNPRREQGDTIVQHILSGIRTPSEVTVIRDRAEAIDYAIGRAAAGDVVLVAGKGHENYQDVDGVRHIFSDASHARLALQSKTAGRSADGSASGSGEAQ
ncbi:MAG: UDP-N-acetylmuramoyl-L-alanyl-D-glutamate--2,6-diaminopimelate ligase [Pseudohongiellaceae bacterium]